MRLYSYWRSTAAYRVRIAMELKEINYDYVAVHLVKDGGHQHSDSYRDINPMSLVPLLETDQGTISQSLSIIKFLESRCPEPSLYTGNNFLDAQIDSLALTICCDIHPLNNLRVLQFLGDKLGAEPKQKDNWYKHWIKVGFEAVEKQITRYDKKYCFTDYPTLADICLVAQVYNANRFECDLSGYPKIVEINDRCLKLEAFKRAIPENQPDVD